jgi:hypothetical protein
MFMLSLGMFIIGVLVVGVMGLEHNQVGKS